MKRVHSVEVPVPSASSRKTGSLGIEVQYLVAFVAVFESRSVTAAARRIHRTQSAISHSLSKLRLQLGDELFALRAGEMHPTTHAQSIYPAIAQALQLIESIRAGARKFDARRDPFDLRVGMTDYEEQLLTPRLWADIERRAPGVRLLVRSINRYAAEPMVLSGALDLAIVGNPVCRHVDIECTPLQSEPYVVACSESVKVASAMTLERYLAADHLRVEVGGETFGTVDDTLRALGRTRRVRCVVPTYSTMPDLLRASSLFATHSRGVFISNGQIREGLQLFDPPFDLEPIEIALVSLQDAKASAAQRWAVSLIRSVIDDHRSAKGSAPRGKRNSQRTVPSESARGT